MVSDIAANYKAQSLYRSVSVREEFGDPDPVHPTEVCMEESLRGGLRGLRRKSVGQRQWK